MKYVVYKHTCPNRKVYIGLTCKKPSTRWNKGLGYKKQPLFYNAIKKYGWETIKSEVLFENLTKEAAEQKEIELIKVFKSNEREYGYNIANGGNTVGTHSDESKRKMSESHKGEKNPMWGISLKNKHTEETKLKMSAIAKKRFKSEAGTFAGKTHTEESKRKMSESKKESNFKPYITGKNHTEESKQKMSESRKDKKSVICVNTQKIYASIREAADDTGVHKKSIGYCCNGKRKTAGVNLKTGERLVWEFYKD